MEGNITAAVAGVDTSTAPVAKPTAAAEPDPFFESEDHPGEASSGEDPDGPFALPTAEDAEAPEAEVKEAAPDTTKYDVESADGTKKKMTVSEMQAALKASGMLRADHTRKTQELAAARKLLTRDGLTLKSERDKFSASMESAREFFGAISAKNADPYYVMRMLEGQGVPIRAAVQKLAEDVLREQQMPEEERAQRNRERRNRAAIAEEKYHEARVAKAREAAENQRRAVEASTQQKRLGAWSEKALKEAGLPNDSYASDRLRAALREIASKEKRLLTYDDFKDAAAHAKKSLMSPLTSFSEDDLVNDMDEDRARNLALALQKRLKKQPTQQQATPPARASKPQTRAPNGEFKRPSLADRLRGG
jgi:hypothetical protein